VKIDCAGEELELRAERAVFWAAASTLFAADLHLGKAATFRHHGVPIPEGAATSDLGRLARLIQATGACTLVVLGDLFHAPQGLKTEVLAEWRSWCDSLPALEIQLLLGNHDRRCRLAELDLRLDIRQESHVGPFDLRHEPLDTPRPDRFWLAGHIHPVVRCGDRFGTSLRLPAFVQSASGLLLPAFGSFCGGGRIKPGPGDRVFGCVEEAVVELPQSLCA
jgi:DNA ligase-associated metallophosphoesterase